MSDEQIRKAKIMAFAEKQCAMNRNRMAREAKGDYGQPLHICSKKNRVDNKGVTHARTRDN